MGADPAKMSGDAGFTNVQLTPTRSIFVMQAGPMNITITFLSPVEVRRSILSNNIAAPLKTLVPSARRLGQAVDSIFIHVCGG